MRIGGDGPRIGPGWSFVLVAALTTWPADHHGDSRCEVAFKAREWARVAAECHAPRWTDRARLASAWIAWGDRHPEEALELAEQLLDTSVAADAAYLAGYIRGERDEASDLARARLQQALTGYQLAGRHADASRAASFLSRVPRPERRFDDQLHMAQLAVTEAELSGDVHILGRALGALAESYDLIGMEGAARETFLRAEELTAPWPEDLAFIYFKHALFLLDLGTPQNLETSLRYLDAAETTSDQATTTGLGDKAARLHVAIRLNRADALSQLGRIDAAERELDAAERRLGPTTDVEPRGKVLLVKGYVAARLHDLATAEALFAQVDDGTLPGDYRWRMALELARLYRDAGDRGNAEQAYRTAIDIIEQLRRAAGVIELRPWVLARRTRPYIELLALLVDQNRGIEALAVAESLHARTWLDVVLARETGGATTAAHALTVARLRQRFRAMPASALDGPALMALTGDREALVFLSIGSATWRAHVAHGQVRVQPLPDDTVIVANKFRTTPGDRMASERATDALLPAELTASKEPLYVIANGPLADVPFAALRPHGRYLIEERPVSRLPGLAALRCTPSTWNRRTILVGDSRGDLPEAAHEVQQLAASSGVPAYIGPAATRSALAPAHGAQLLHLAVHGNATSSGRAIVLADGDMTAADVLEADLDPELVVLSGCATAASDDAESWDGFPSAFLAAGSRYVVATLRSIEDAAAARVTSAYYAQPASLNPIERLAAAQRTLAGVLPVEVWASFTAWGSAACEASPSASNRTRGM